MEGRFVALVSGRVQGVFFRAYTKSTARDLGVVGYVANLRDGRVKVVAEGERKKLEKLVKWLENEGSPHSRVDKVKIEWEEPKEEFQTFDVRYF